MCYIFYTHTNKNGCIVICNVYICYFITYSIVILYCSFERMNLKNHQGGGVVNVRTDKKYLYRSKRKKQFKNIGRTRLHTVLIVGTFCLTR